MLEPIHAGMDIIENRAYHDLLLLYRGEKTADGLLAAAREEGDFAFATTGYGVGGWHLIGGRQAAALAIFDEIVAGEAWAAFGFLAAEAELARVLRTPESDVEGR